MKRPVVPPQSPDTFRIVSANMGSRKRPGRQRSKGFRRYRRHLITFIKDSGLPGVLGMQEVGSGQFATRLKGVGLRIRNRARLELGKTGVHRFVAAGTIRIGRKRTGRKRIRLFVPHGLHQGTVGRLATRAHLALLGRRTRRRNDNDTLWATLGDFNQGILAVLKQLEGNAVVGKSPDAIVISEGLRVVDWGVDDWGVREGIVNHPFVWADVEVVR